MRWIGGIGMFVLKAVFYPLFFIMGEIEKLEEKDKQNVWHSINDYWGD